MKIPSFIAVACLALPFVVGGSVSTYSQTGCLTRSALIKPKVVPTVTNSRTTSITRRLTSVYTPTSTIKPASVTVTETTTSTASTTVVLTQIVDTFTETSTISETETSTTLLSTTEFFSATATTVNTDTTTISTSAGFTPLASGLALMGVPATKNRRSKTGPVHAAAAIREAANTLSLKERAAPAKSALCPKKGGPSLYPAAVNCYRFIKVITISTVTSTARTTKTVTAAPGTVSQTVTTVVSTTLTSMPADASTTETISSTTSLTEISTIYTTFSVTLTSTSTSFAPQATTYAACTSNNLISVLNGGQAITNAYIVDMSYAYQYGATAATAYDCCVLCQQTATCGMAAFSSGACVLATSNTCSASVFAVDLATSGNDGYTFSNGPCGQAKYDGVYTQG
ncbi:hypothetical protein LTR17_022284 [Elasticomyces elasticus]|nr:hypothetical protein LTR17_022284 [Elasticomyces elasticus]